MKHMYEYVNVRVPSIVKDDVEIMYRELEKSGIKVRKADIYREAIKAFKDSGKFNDLVKNS